MLFGGANDLHYMSYVTVAPHAWVWRGGAIPTGPNGSMTITIGSISADHLLRHMTRCSATHARVSVYSI